MSIAGACVPPNTFGSFSTTYFRPVSAKKRKRYNAVSINCVNVFANTGVKYVVLKLSSYISFAILIRSTTIAEKAVSRLQRFTTHLSHDVRGHVYHVHASSHPWDLTYKE